MKAAALTAAAAMLAVAPAAHADTLIAPATGAQHVTAAGNVTAWSQPDGGRYRLVIDGQAAPVAPVAPVATPVNADLGSNAFTGQHVVAVYARDGDIYLYDPPTRKERKVPGASSKAYRESAPSIANGVIAFVRRGGRHNGVYVTRLPRSGANARVVRIDGHLARETAVSQSRVAFLYPNGKGSEDITLSQLDGHNKRLIRRTTAAFNLMITRYKVGWLELDGHRVVGKLTNRINPSDTRPRIASADLPSSANSAAIAHDRVIDTYADAEGVKRISPPLFAG